MEFKNEYEFLSNEYPCPIECNGKSFPSVDSAYKDFINNNSDWSDSFFEVMYRLLEIKFSKKDMKQKLLATGNLYIVAECGGAFWGVRDGEGMNMLGKMIMEIRENIKSTTEKPIRKVIVAGSRSFNDYKLLKEKLDKFFANITPVIVCGEARGADELGRRYATENSFKILSYPADWSKRKAAGFRRNEQMAKVADCLVAFWDGKSSGTKHMIETMRKLKKSIRIVKFYQ